MKTTTTTLSNTNRIGLFDINFDTGEAYWSRELRHILGLPFNLPAHFGLLLHCIHPADRRAFAAAAARVFQPNCPAFSTLEPRIVRGRGEVQRLHIDMQTLFRSDGARDAIRIVGLVVQVATRGSASSDQFAVAANRNAYIEATFAATATDAVLAHAS